MQACEQWRLILDGCASGHRNMAVDDALMTSVLCAERIAAWSHTLRLYWFEPPALSIGANQPLAEIDLAACAAAGVDVVRRPTGGRAVLHDGCITYSVCGPAEGAVFGGGIHASYRRISEALVSAVRELGLAAVLPATPKSRSTSTPSCFDSAAPYELLVAGRKLVGSAQVRRSGVALQHGSLRLWSGSVQTPALVNARSARLRTVESVDPPTLSELLGRSVSRAAAGAALADGFSRSFSVTLCPAGLDEHENQLAIAVDTGRYNSSQWTSRR